MRALMNEVLKGGYKPVKKIKKMNMGGVVPGRGGSFKGTR